MVASIGVLHHTNDCHKAISHLSTRLVKPGGHLLVGLYHSYGRKPFLDHFAQMKRAGASEVKMLEEYRRIHPIADEVHLQSWFRDQVMHPHETQHTLREIMSVIEPLGMKLVSASLNRFQPFRSNEDLYNGEQNLEQVGKKQLEMGKYYPGFFVFLAQKVG